MTAEQLCDIIAAFLKDGETDEDGNEFILENDDAVDSLHDLINIARDIVKEDP